MECVRKDSYARVAIKRKTRDWELDRVTSRGPLGGWRRIAASRPRRLLKRRRITETNGGSSRLISALDNLKSENMQPLPLEWNERMQLTSLDKKIYLKTNRSTGVASSHFGSPPQWLSAGLELSAVSVE